MGSKDNASDSTLVEVKRMSEFNVEVMTIMTTITFATVLQLLGGFDCL